MHVQYMALGSNRPYASGTEGLSQALARTGQPICVISVLNVEFVVVKREV